MFEDKRFLVFGAGISGIGAVKLLSTVTDKIILYDGNTNIDIDELQAKTESTCNIVLGALRQDIVEQTDIAVLSPGVPVDKAEVVALRNAGAEIWGEVELAYRFTKGMLLAITGTNGKTTTTTLVGEIAKAWNPDTFVTGNIGVAYASCAKETLRRYVPRSPTSRTVPWRCWSHSRSWTKASPPNASMSPPIAVPLPRSGWRWRKAGVWQSTR